MEFRRRFIGGASLLELDSAGRILLPTSFLNHAEIDLNKNNEIVIAGVGTVLEIWNKDAREKMLNDRGGLEDLTAKVRKQIDPGTPGHLMN
jgi:MraZ protein